MWKGLELWTEEAIECYEPSLMVILLRAWKNSERNMDHGRLAQEVSDWSKDTVGNGNRVLF